MLKNNWYEGWEHPSPDRWTLFTDQDIKRQGKTRLLVANLYALTSLVSYEPHVDACNDRFRNRLSEMANHQKPVDMPHWFQCYAFDLIGNITYGKRFRVLDQGYDIGNVMRALDRAMVYGTLVGVGVVHPAP
ncbi:hypothetical protein ACHAPJ_010967 [Fusarium lateritium]